MNMCQQCWDIFIDINNMLYCSLSERHQIIANSLNNDLSRSTIVGRTGSAGSTSTTLQNSRGIFVDTTLNLYVADCGNNRVVGSDARAISFDSSDNIFVSDQGKNRIQKFSLLTDSSGKYTKIFQK